jgi:hypothetical protein
MSSESPAPTTATVHARLAAIEQSLDSGDYAPGPWHALVRELRGASDEVRRSVAGEVTRVSRKLHQRAGRRTFDLESALLLEGLGTALGGVLLALAVARESGWLAILGALAWTTTFQPLIKLGVGRLLGVGYDYGYLFAIEPRFKMSYGSYLAAPRWARITLHASGMVGSPLGLAMAALIVGDATPRAASIIWVVFWVIVAGNLIPFAGALLGFNRMGAWNFATAGGGVAGMELREALGVKPRVAG